MVKRRAAVVLGLLLLSAAFAAFALAGQTRANGTTSVLAVLAGRVELAHGTAVYAVAADGEAVMAGDRVRTDGAGHAVVTFFDGSTLEIAPATEITVTAAFSRDGAVDLVITQAIGRTISSVQKLVDPRSRYEVRTPSLAAVVRGTKFEIEVAADGSATERTTEGLVAVSSAGSEVFVPAGTETRAAPGTAPRPPAPIPSPATTSAPPTAAPAVTTATPAPTQALGTAAGATSAPPRDPPSATPAITSPAPSPTLVIAPASAPATLAPPTLAPLPSATLVPQPTATIAPLPTVSPVPLTTPSIAPLPSISVSPVNSALPVLSPTGSVLPTTTIP